MAQIIKHRRGTPEQLKTKTLNAAEIGVSTGSFFSGTPIVHIGDGANASGYVIGRLHYGSTVPTLNAGNIGASYNDIQFYDTATYKLVYLHTAGNQTMNLTGNIAGGFVTGSLGVSGSFVATGSNFSIQSDGSVSGSGTSTGSFGKLLGDAAQLSNLPAGYSVANSSNNRILTSVDSTNANAEANLTYDGSTLEIKAGNVSGSGTSTGSFGYLQGDGGGITNLTSAAISTYNSSGNNRLITSADSSTVQGEANAIFDGTLLSLTGSLDVSADVDVDGTLEADAITVGGTALNTVIAGVTVSNATAAATATVATTVTITDNESTDESNAIIFAAGGDVDGGNLGLESDGTLTYNPSDGKVTATGFVGALTGQADTVATIAGLAPNTATTAASQPNITSLGTLTTLTVDNVIINGTTIGHTSDTDLLTLSDGKLVLAGDLEVQGTTTTVSSTEVSIADRILTLNASSAGGDGGLYVNDADATETGSLLWDVSEDRWIGGIKDSEVNLVTISSTDTLTNKTLTTPTISSFANANHDHSNSAGGGNIALGTATTGNYVGTVTAGSGLTSTGATTGEGIAHSLSVDAAQTGITSLLATDIKIGEDDQTKIDFETADEIHFYAANVEQVYLGDNIFGPQSDSDVDLGSTGVRWKDAYVDSITVTGEIDGDSLDIEGDADINGTLNADNVDIDGTLNVALAADFVGALHAQAGLQVSASALEVGNDLKLNYSTTTVPRMLFQAADETVDFVAAPSSTSTNGDTAGEYVRWTGTAFEMSQTIDGGSF